MYPAVSLFIDGTWTQGQSAKTIPVLNPATDEVLNTVSYAEKPDLDRALAAAEKLRVPMPLASLVHDRLQALIARGGEQLDWSAIGQLAAQDAGLR